MNRNILIVSLSASQSIITHERQSPALLLQSLYFLRWPILSKYFNWSSNNNIISLHWVAIPRPLVPKSLIDGLCQTPDITHYILHFVLKFSFITIQFLSRFLVIKIYLYFMHEWDTSVIQRSIKDLHLVSIYLYLYSLNLRK